ncbi:hypothetical protein V498_10073, partial [Pseudogymnoascus sp. VKM F-4517 (FW-2822)]
STHDFYARTRSRLESDGGSSLDKITPHHKTGGDDDDKVAEAMSRRLMDAEVAAKELANKKAPTRESVMGDDGGVSGDKDRGKSEKTAPVVPVVKDIVKDGKGAKDRNVAGRKKYPIPEDEVKEAKAEKVDDSDEAVTAEMNGILKMSPNPPANPTVHSHHLLQILLRLLAQSQANPPHQVRHYTDPLRRGAGQAPPRRRAAGAPCDHDGAQDGAECVGEGEEYWGRG